MGRRGSQSQSECIGFRFVVVVVSRVSLICHHRVSSWVCVKKLLLFGGRLDVGLHSNGGLGEQSTSSASDTLKFRPRRRRFRRFLRRNVRTIVESHVLHRSVLRRTRWRRFGVDGAQNASRRAHGCRCAAWRATGERALGRGRSRRRSRRGLGDARRRFDTLEMRNFHLGGVQRHFERIYSRSSGGSL